MSVAINIVEGFGGQGKKELKHFINISLGSLSETEYLLDFSLKLGYLQMERYKELQGLRKEVGSLLWKFYRSLK